MATNEPIRARLNLQRPIATADKSAGRFVLNHALLTPCDEGAYLASTDGKVAAVMLADGECPDGAEHLVPNEIIAKVPKKGKRTELNGQWLTDGKTLTPPVCGLFPAMQDVLPSLTATPPTFAVTLNAELLARLQQTISRDEDGSASVTLLFTAQGAPLVVVGSDGIGVVMPITRDAPRTADGRKGIESTDQLIERVTERYTAVRNDYAKCRAGRARNIDDTLANHAADAETTV